MVLSKQEGFILAVRGGPSLQTHYMEKILNSLSFVQGFVRASLAIAKYGPFHFPLKKSSLKYRR